MRIPDKIQIAGRIYAVEYNDECFTEQFAELLYQIIKQIEGKTNGK